MNLIINHTVGYMLKALKLGVDTSSFGKEFASIRHGNYYEFCNRTNANIPTLVEYQEGQISVTNSIKKNDIDFAGLLKSGPAMKKLLSELINQFGELIDSDISDETYLKVAEFEIAIRMHANNNQLIKNDDNLIDIISKISEFKGLNEEETKQLQLGRKFLNMIKHPKNQFKTWDEGIKEFDKAFKILEGYHIKVK